MGTEIVSPVYVDAFVVDEDLIKVMKVEQMMRDRLTADQMHELRDALESVFLGTEQAQAKDTKNYVELFIQAKMVENLSKRTIAYYRETLRIALGYVNKPIRNFDANDIRSILAWYMNERGCSPVTVNNVRRVLSSFFQWMEDEDFVRKSPVKKTRSLHTEKAEKMPFSDMEVALIQNACETTRDRAIVELLLSSGMRVGELCGLNKSDVDIDSRECNVLGKGNKLRTCYFNATAAMYISLYLKSRDDEEPALFVSKNKPHRRLMIHAAEKLIRDIGKRAHIKNAHPHRFRRTFATNSLRKGLAIEEIQQLLGHENIETTMIYAKVDREMLKTKAKRLA